MPRSVLDDVKAIRKVYHERLGGNPFETHDGKPYVPWVPTWQCQYCDVFLDDGGKAHGTCAGKCCFG